MTPTTELTTITAVSPVVTFIPRKAGRPRLPALELHKAFLAIVEQGSVHKAADALYLNQASVSNRLRSLELRLGVELFERHPGLPLQLTKAGEKVHEQLQSMREKDRLDVAIRILVFPKCGHSRIHTEDDKHLFFGGNGALVLETAVYVCWECFKAFGRKYVREPGQWFQYPKLERE